MRLIDADRFEQDLYHEAFEKDSDMQRWDSGCWIRFKLAENVLNNQPTIKHSGWHDLRRDPHDLPEDFKLCNVLVDYTDEKEYGIGYACVGRFKECHTFDGYSIGEAYMQHNDVKVIAWRYIEPFEEET